LDAANAQKILGYFIEEAKEHLETLEKGILDLSNMANDSEQVNEMFRAAHSVKGGAAMLGYTSIQKTAHRLEDAFKILRENYVKVDQKLESLFLKGYDILQELVDKLQGPFGLPEEEAKVILAKGEPAFSELQNHLNNLLGNSNSLQKDKEVTFTSGITFISKVRSLLKQMLDIFKQQPTLNNRKQLQELCEELSQLVPKENQWQTLVKTSKTAIANPKNNYRTLAPVVIKELKQAGDLIELKRGGDIAISKELQELATSSLPQILVTLEPKSVASTLLQMFNQQQVSQLVKLLQSAR
jgi:chemotaxis protein histidine kinase CheA